MASLDHVTVNRIDDAARAALAHSWQRAWRGAGLCGEGHALHDALLAAYAEPQRHYHSLQHLAECMQHFEQAHALAQHPAELAFALWFHDAVYDPARADNEARSADWARDALLQAGARPALAARVHALVLMTRHTGVPVDDDDRLLVDIDLAILGAPPPRFAEYERQIRAEYAFVPRAEFEHKRRAILCSFLERERLYGTEHFHALLEAQARQNLHRATGREQDTAAVTIAGDPGLRTYYAARAHEYDAVYAKPERQADLRALEQWLPSCFEGRRVLEIACGTGWWTRVIAPVAASVVALDAAIETLTIAEQRVPAGHVKFRVGDAYALPAGEPAFDAAFAGFWFSHVPLHRQREFLAGLDAALAPDARVVLLDNLFVSGSSSAISERDEAGNTYQSRRLDDGSQHRVLKNFPDEAQLRALVAGVGGTQAALRSWNHYWTFEYRTRDR